MSQMTARDKILGRLRAADCKPLPMPDVAAFYAQRLHEDLPTRVERLALNLSNAMAEVHRTTTAELPAALARVIRDKSLPTVAVGPEVLARQSLCDQLQMPADLQAFQRRWNQVTTTPLAPLTRAALDAWSLWSRQTQQLLMRQTDLTTQLIEFARQKR